jgi:hypothetical protein
VAVRRSRATYAIGVVRPFAVGQDPAEKLVRKDGADWCVDALDVLVLADQPIRLGETVIRRYAPIAASAFSSAASVEGQTSSTAAVFDVYRSERTDVRYSTDRGVVKCGTMTLDLDDGGAASVSRQSQTKEILVHTTFAGTEIKVTAIDVITGRKALIKVDFLSQ